MMADAMNDDMTDIPPINWYLSAIAVCNSLALLTSQGTLTVYLQRLRLLKRIQRIWTKGSDAEIVFMNTADTDSDVEQWPVELKENQNIRHDLESVKTEVNEVGILPDGCLLEQVREDVKDKVLEDIKQVKEENKQRRSRCVRSNGHRLQRFKTKGKIRRKTRAGKSSARAKTPLGQKDRILSETLNMVSAGEGTIDDDATGPTEFAFICTDCGLHLRTFLQLKDHRLQRHGFNFDRQMLANLPEDVVEGNGDRLNESEKSSKCKKRNNDCELTCSVCKKTFSMKYELRLHQMIHSGERPYMCSICGKRFRIRSVLTGHMKIHLGDKRHSCPQCGKSFVQASGLKDHLAVHSKIRAHVCNVCGKDFIRITMLNYHMRSHTGEKPYFCSVCEKRFALSRQLNTHLRIHSNEWRYSCDVCSKKFKFKGGLNRHKRLHEEMKPFSCSVCPKVFTQAGNLRVHMRTHTGEKPYICSNCGQKFSHQPTLKKHRESCHRI